MIRFITCPLEWKSWLRKTWSGIVSKHIYSNAALSDFYASKDSILQSWKWASIPKLASLHCVKLSVFEIFLYSKFSYVCFSWHLLSLKMTCIINIFYVMRGNQCVLLYFFVSGEPIMDIGYHNILLMEFIYKRGQQNGEGVKERGLSASW